MRVMRLRTMVLVASCLACSVPGQATEQRPEIVLMNGGVYYLPLTYGREKNVLPLRLLWRDARARLGAQPRSTGCYRGYVGIWEIQDDRLFLRGLDGWTDLKKDVKLDMKTIFPERFEDGRVKADWFDGELTFLRRGFSSPEVERTKLPFAKGQVVAPATAQRVGMEARADTGPAAPEVDRDRRLYARRGEAQIPDIFILEGVVHYLPAEYSVKAFALESLWSDPKTRPRLLRFLEGGYPYRFSRGYRAIWEVHEGSLYLLALEGWIQGEKVHLRALLPDRFRNGRVKAEWFSGDLALISDEMLPLVARVRPQDPPQDAPKVKLEVKDGEVVSVEYEGKQREVGSRD